MEQQILIASEGYKELDDYFTENDIKKVLLVCGNSLSALKLGEYFENLENHLGIQVVKFKEFQPNPRYESVVKGVKVFRQNHCDAIVAVGGGSAMDVAKCIKLYSNMESDENYLRQEIIPNDIKFLAVPTTAGTGSETTRYAVIYYNGEKQSVTHESCIPTTVLMDVTVKKTLPDYQRKVTMLDALCHAVESYWSVNSTEESRGYSQKAIEIFNKMLREYGLYRDFEAKQEEYQVLSQSVNPVRLKNNPIELDLEAIDNLYHQILAS